MGNKTVSFSACVKRVVRDIPQGRVLSYAAVAIKAGFPGAARAVGTLMKKNFDPNIPCHRVICSDGRLGQYNRGSAAKEQKLKQEGIAISHGRLMPEVKRT